MNFSANSVREAEEFFNSLREPFHVEKSAKRISSAAVFARKLLLPWKPQAFVYMEKYFIDSKVQFLDFEIRKLLKNGPNFTWTDELYVKKIFLDWSPYISSKLAGMTTVYLADLRSTDYKNSLVAGYIFKSSDSVHGMAISPGYLINLRDKNLDRIFKFLVITSGLDCMEGSTFGSLTLSMEVYIGSSAINPRKMHLPGLTLVANKQALTILQSAPDQSSVILENINLEDILKAFDNQSNKFSSGQALMLNEPTDLQKIVNAAMRNPQLPRSLSLNQEGVKAMESSRLSVDIPRNRPLLVSKAPVCGLSHFPSVPVKHKGECSSSSKQQAEENANSLNHDAEDSDDSRVII